MKTAQFALGASAHNIGNLSTADFRPDLVTQEAAGGGVTASLGQASLEGHDALEADIVGQLTAKHQFLANLAVFKTSDQVLGASLDIAG